MTEIEKLKKLTGESDEELLSLLLSEAEEFVLSYTNRTRLVSSLERGVRDLAFSAWNRMGTDGKSAKSGSGDSYTIDTAPKNIYDVMNRYRLARVGGKTFEAQEK